MVDPQPSDDSTFLHSILYFLAVLGLVSGTLSVLTYFVHGSWGWGGYWVPGSIFSGAMRSIYLGIMVLGWANVILLIVSSIGLLRLKRWSRMGFIVWALVSIGAGLAGGLLISTAYPQLAGRPRYYLPAVLFLGTLERSLFPLLVLCVLMQRQCARLWAHDSAGFQVIPMAQRAAEQPESGLG